MGVRHRLAGGVPSEGRVVEDQTDPLVRVGLESVHAVDVTGAASAVEEDVARGGDLAHVGLAEDAVAWAGFLGRGPFVAAEAGVDEFVFEFEGGRVEGCAIFGVVLQDEGLA